MSKLCNIKFNVGEVSCVVLFVQPNNTPAMRIGNYYEHRHPCLELHYSISGCADYLIDKREVRLNAGELLIIPARTYHKEIFETEDSNKMTLTLDVQLPTDGATSSDRAFHRAFSQESEITINVNKGLLKETLLRIKQIASEPDEGYLTTEKLRAACHTLTVELYDLLSETKGTKTDTKEETPLSREHEIDTFIAINFKKNNAKELLADELHVSPRQLHRIIKKSYGKNYREKLSEMRIKIATSFLSDSDKSIGEIADILGYGSAANFSTFIKRVSGKTPSQIRAEAKKAKQKAPLLIP